MEHIELQNYLNLKCNSISNYIRFIVSSKRRETEQLYNNKFNSLYGWKVGKLKGDEIKDAIVYFITNGNIPEEVLNYGDGTIKKYALVIDVVKKFSKGNDLLKLTNKEWFEIREEYEKEMKRENEHSFDNSFEEKVKSKSVSQDENELLVYIKDQVENILEDISECGWFIEIRQTIGLYNHRIIIINQSIPSEEKDKIFITAVNKVAGFFSNTYEKNEFSIKSLNDNCFIDGYFLMSEEFYG